MSFSLKCLFVCAGLSIWAPSRSWSLEAAEYRIKATYLYNFAKFTEWPDVKAKVGAPLNICVIGKDPFAGDLDKLVTGKSINNRPLRVRYNTPLDDVTSCHIVFVTSAETKNLPAIMRKLDASQVLGVGEVPEFIQKGGHIQFFVEREKVGFEVNLPAVERAGMKIDARVLKIAKVRR